MQFEILGPLRVRADGDDLELGPPAQRAFLAVLLTSPNVPIADDRLIDELWGEDPPPTARHMLQVYASHLRRLGDRPETRIVRAGAGYAVRAEPDEVDAERFLAAVAHGRELLGADPEAAERLLASAMRLWRGPPFGDLPEPPHAVRDEADHLEREHREALETWIELRLDLGRHRELVPELTTLVSHDPYDEALHADLMLALYRCGRQAEALETARRLRDRLREDLGVDASPPVLDLYHRILLHAPELALEPSPPPGNLPSRLTSFVGRSWELRELGLLVDASRLVTLTGPAGVGKTRLAIEAARQLAPRVPGGTWWIDLAPVTDPDTVPEVAAEVLGLTCPPGVDPRHAIARRLGRRPTSLVLDNCEHVSEAVADLVASVSREAPGVRVLATSRTPLQVEGEQVWLVPPLSLRSQDGGPEEPASGDAVQLFVERGRAADPSFVLSADDAGTVEEVCRKLDGLPLAIEMAAARIPILTPQEILRYLDQRFALLRRPTTEGPARHRTLEAAFDASYALMSEPDRRVFERLSVFVGPFDLDAFAAVGSFDAPEAALDQVAALVGASMLSAERDRGQTRYRLLESLREYGAARLRARGDGDDARGAHAGYHLGMVEEAGAVVNTPAFADRMRRLEDSYDDIQEALRWSLAHQDRAVTLRAAPALREFWFRRADGRGAERWTARMLEGDLEDVPAGLLTEVHVAAALAADLANDRATEAFHAQEAERLSRASDDDPAALDAGRWAQAHIALSLGDLDAVRRGAAEALAACEARGDRWGRAWPLTLLGMASLFGGSPVDARERFEEALPLYRELADTASLVLFTLTPLCLIALRQRDLDAAERHATEAMALAEGTGWGSAGLVFYGEVLAERGDLDAADAFARRALRSAYDAGLENWLRMSLRDLARTAALRDRCERAAVLLAASRCDMPSWGLDPAIYGPVEQRCREELGEERYGRLAGQGERMDHRLLLDFADADEPADAERR